MKTINELYNEDLLWRCELDEILLDLTSIPSSRERKYSQDLNGLLVRAHKLENLIKMHEDRLKLELDPSDGPINEVYSEHDHYGEEILELKYDIRKFKSQYRGIEERNLMNKTQKRKLQ